MSSNWKSEPVANSLRAGTSGSARPPQPCPVHNVALKPSATPRSAPRIPAPTPRRPIKPVSSGTAGSQPTGFAVEAMIAVSTVPDDERDVYRDDQRTWASEQAEVLLLRDLDALDWEHLMPRSRQSGQRDPLRLGLPLRAARRADSAHGAPSGPVREDRSLARWVVVAELRPRLRPRAGRLR